ncbi:MAG: thioredoxin domain-containing protein [Nitrospinae bacterium]|nr:thioredoxin domain-containing protein [Nitrospinota bacterium]
MKKYLSLFTILFLFFLNTAYAGYLPDIKGKFDYVKGVKEFKKYPKLEVVEFFNFSCTHCYKFLQTGEERILKKFGNKIDYNTYPIFWGKQTHYPALLYLMFDGNEKQKREFRKMIFDANFQDQVNIFDKRIIAMLPSDFTLANKFSQNADNPLMVRKTNEVLALADELNVHETPTIIINQSLVITPSTTGGTMESFVENIEVVIESILQKYYKK